jgi:hypothetical protein
MKNAGNQINFHEAAGIQTLNLQRQVGSIHAHRKRWSHKRTWERECNLKMLLRMLSMVSCCSGVRLRALKLAVKGPSRNLPYVGGVQPVAILLAVFEVAREYAVKE